MPLFLKSADFLRKSGQERRERLWTDHKLTEKILVVQKCGNLGQGLEIKTPFWLWFECSSKTFTKPREGVMGLTPREKDLTNTFDCQFKVKVSDVTLTTLLKAFTYLLPKILVDFIQKALI